MTDAGWVPVLEIGGTHVTSARVASDRGTVDAASVRRRPLAAAGPADALLGSLLASAADVSGNGDVWGIAMPAPFDYATGVAWFRGVGKFESLYGVDVAAALYAGIQPPPRRLHFVNDADAFVLGEWAAGALAGTGRAAGFTLGTGVGSGFVAAGRLVQAGPGVPPGGRINDVEVGGQPLEEVISRRALRRAYAQASTGMDGSGPDVREIAERARAGESAAIAVLAKGFGTLGAVVGPRCAAFGAERVVVGGSMAASWDLFEPWFSAGWASTGARPIEVVVSAGAELAALAGAARSAQLG